MPVKKADLVAALVLIAFGLFYAFLTTRLPDRNLPNTLGLDFMPWLLVISLLALSGLLLALTLTGKDGGGGGWIRRREVFGVVFLTTAVFLYIKVIDLFGYLGTTPFFLALMMVVSGSRSWRRIVIVALVTTAGIYLFFNRVFQIQLPGGSLL